MPSKHLVGKPDLIFRVSQTKKS